MRGTRPLTSNEVKALKAVFGGRLGNRNRALFMLGINTGFRISELLSLTVGDILDFDGKIKERLTVSRRYMKKKQTSRTVKLNKAAAAGVKPWLLELKGSGVVHTTDVLFPALRRDNKAISRVQAWNILKAAYKACGLKGHLATHSMRKTFANNIHNHFLTRVANGEAIDAFRSTSKALGHVDIKSTDQYLSFLEADLDESIDAIGI